ncbi:helix-turn-helix transcriptional regulator [Pelagibacteraceae bacterium]|jgi:transcriptional regulator with XRE-family HTH domain|nr:helix-turn-helix transcriptional regulator [Pelagibacteraceae bacterium]
MEENFNVHLGKKLRLRRLSLGLTQTKVALAINVTFQQIQKYEKGTNGVSSNRLMQLSQFLKVPIIYFFEDYKEFKDVGSETLGENSDDLNYSFLSRTFSSLSKIQKEKILQILNNTSKFEKVG